MGITTKNDLAQERYQDLIEYFDDEKVAKIILGNRGQFKAWLERLRWHVKRADELARELEQLKGITNNDLAVDCISRQEVLRLLANSIGKTNTYLQTEVLRMPSVTPQEPRKGHWIDSSNGWMCSECNKDNTFDTNYCPFCGAEMKMNEVEE